MVAGLAKCSHGQRSLVNNPADRKFLRTNGPGMFAGYNGIGLSLDRRYADRWTANFGYACSRSEGLEINPGSAAIASTGGQDPNDYVNFTGRLSPNDRPHLFNATGTLVQGIPSGAQFQVGMRSRNSASTPSRRAYSRAPLSARRAPGPSRVNCRCGEGILPSKF
jgi:hypothetical protein